MNKCLRSYWLNRFQVNQLDNKLLRFVDRLSATNLYTDYEPRMFSSPLMDFKYGFLHGYNGSKFKDINDSPITLDDTFFWQFPCRTECLAAEKHKLVEPGTSDDQKKLHLYLGLPWATWIDFSEQSAWKGNAKEQFEAQLKYNEVYFKGIKHALAGLGVELRLHTVCQHIHWRNFIALWGKLGITDLWLSHCPSDYLQNSTDYIIELHPWSLYAVNVEDDERSLGVRKGIDPVDKNVLASFVGAHMDHYISDIRLRLLTFANESDFTIQVNQSWHFEDVVYGHQLGSRSLGDSYKVDSTVSDYNRLLSDSVFSLCPTGAGPNTLRLWESLAIGAIPVLLDEGPVLPRDEEIDWSLVVLKIKRHEIPFLPEILRGVSLNERRLRQKACIDAYEKVKKQQCF